jgi:hypothetical protein
LNSRSPANRIDCSGNGFEAFVCVGGEVLGELVQERLQRQGCEEVPSDVTHGPPRGHLSKVSGQPDRLEVLDEMGCVLCRDRLGDEDFGGGSQRLHDYVSQHPHVASLLAAASWVPYGLKYHRLQRGGVVQAGKPPQIPELSRPWPS